MELEQLRNRIDDIDLKVIDLLAERMRLIEQVASYKKAHALPPLDQQRFDRLLIALKDHARLQNLDEKLVQAVYNAIHEYSLQIQSDSHS